MIKFPSILWSIRKYIREKDFFGYWTSYRKWEESIKTEEYLKIRFKTLAWLKNLCQ